MDDVDREWVSSAQALDILRTAQPGLGWNVYERELVDHATKGRVATRFRGGDLNVTSSRPVPEPRPFQSGDLSGREMEPGLWAVLTTRDPYGAGLGYNLRDGTFRGRRNKGWWRVEIDAYGLQFDKISLLQITGPLPLNVETTYQQINTSKSDSSEQVLERPRAKWWPDFVAELVYFLKMEAMPVHDDACIDEIFSRLAARGKKEPGRTAVQPIIKAVRDRFDEGE